MAKPFSSDEVRTSRAAPHDRIVLELLKGDETIRSRSLTATVPQAKSFERDGLADLRENPLAKSSIPTLFDATQRATSNSRPYGHSRDTAV